MEVEEDWKKYGMQFIVKYKPQNGLEMFCQNSFLFPSLNRLQ
jgi:hypothetical protein